MAIVLEVQVVNQPSRRIVLRRGQVAVFGSDVWTDCSLPTDSGLAPRHFRLDCRDDRCTLEVLEHQPDVTHNAIPVRAAELRDGDRLTIGPTTIRVAFGGLEADWAARASVATGPRFSQSTQDACLGIDWPPAAATLIAGSPNPVACVDALMTAGLTREAVRVLAAVLPPRAAIWWLWSCLPDALDASARESSGRALEQQIEKWIISPSEFLRREVEGMLSSADPQAPTTWLGWAVVWTGASLAPPTVSAVPPPAHLVGTGVAAAAILLAAKQPRTLAATLAKIVQQGRLVLEGQRPWPTTTVGSAPDSSPVMAAS